MKEDDNKDIIRAIEQEQLKTDVATIDIGDYVRFMLNEEGNRKEYFEGYCYC